MIHIFHSTGSNPWEIFQSRGGGKVFPSLFFFLLQYLFSDAHLRQVRLLVATLVDLVIELIFYSLQRARLTPVGDDIGR